MAEAANHLLLVQVSGGSLQAADGLHLRVHSQCLVPRTARRLLGTGIQAMQLVWLWMAVVRYQVIHPMAHK